MGVILFVGVVVVFGLLLVSSAIRLARKDDWFERVTESQATLYSRLAEYGFWTLRHLTEALREPRERSRRLRRAFLCVLAFVAVATPVFLAANVASLGSVAGHTVAFALGTAAWSMVVESPSLPRRVQAHAPPATVLIPPAAGALIVAILDLVVGGLALSGKVPDPAGEAFAIGAAFVAAGDLVSGVVGLLTAAADHYPFGDPPPPSSTPDAPRSRSRCRRLRRLPRQLRRGRGAKAHEEHHGYADSGEFFDGPMR